MSMPEKFHQTTTNVYTEKTWPIDGEVTVRYSTSGFLHDGHRLLSEISLFHAKYFNFSINLSSSSHSIATSQSDWTGAASLTMPLLFNVNVRRLGIDIIGMRVGLSLKRHIVIVLRSYNDGQQRTKHVVDLNARIMKDDLRFFSYRVACFSVTSCQCLFSFSSLIGVGIGIAITVVGVSC